MKIPREGGPQGRTRDFAYVEFSKEEDMKAALENHGDVSSRSQGVH